MARTGESYVVEVRPSHVDWGEYRNPTNRNPIPGESYVKIPAGAARKLDIRRGDVFTARFSNGHPSMQIKAAGNGYYDAALNVQYAKQFEGIGHGACKAFTPWYESEGFEVGDYVVVTFVSEDEIVFSKR